MFIEVTFWFYMIRVCSMTMKLSQLTARILFLWIYIVSMNWDNRITCDVTILSEDMFRMEDPELFISSSVGNVSNASGRVLQIQLIWCSGFYSDWTREKWILFVSIPAYCQHIVSISGSINVNNLNVFTKYTRSSMFL